MVRAAWLLGLAALFVAACGGTAPERGSVMKIQSPAFAPGAAIAEKFTGDGADVSPTLTLEDVPPHAVELALICDDPDAPTPEPWVHWVIYGIPADTANLSEDYAAAGGVREGMNSWRTPGYRGPQPPSGTHRYFFRLYALDAPVELGPGATKKELLAAIDGHVIAEAELMGTYTAK